MSHKEKLFNILKEFNKSIGSDHKLEKSIGRLEEYYSSLESKAGINNVINTALESFYDNSLSDESLIGIEKTLDRVKSLRAKLAMIGVRTSWEASVINKATDGKLVFKLVEFEKSSTRQVRYSDISTLYTYDNSNTDRIILNLGNVYTTDISSPNSYINMMLELEAIEVSNDFPKAIMFTPTTYRYFELNGQDLEDIHPSDAARLINENLMRYIYKVLINNYSNNSNLTQDYIRKLQSLVPAIKYNLDCLVDCTIDVLKFFKYLYKNRRTDSQYGIIGRNSGGYSEPVISTTTMIYMLERFNKLYSILEDEDKLNRVIAKAFGHLKDDTLNSKIRAIENYLEYILGYSHFQQTLSELTLGDMISHNNVPDSFIEAIQLLKQGSIVSNLDANAQIKITDKLSELLEASISY
jgi:hypothetical protein